MPQTVVPMLHVPDVTAAIHWYTSIGFHLVRKEDDGQDVTWAKLSYADSEVMFDAGGKPSSAERREVDLYVIVDNVDDLCARLAGRVQIVVPLYDAFYGMREFVIRDLNGFWITFGQPISM